MRKGLIVAGIAGSIFGATPAAHATAVPFDVHYALGEQELEAGATYSEELPMIGACGEDTCTGLRATAGVSPVSAEIGPIQLTLRGWLCIADGSPSCSPDGTPFTGVRLTERVLTAPEGRADLIPLDLSFCVWRGSWSPNMCGDATTTGLEIHGGDDVQDPVPQDLGASFGS